jgi:DNA repair protein RAD7
VCIRLLPKTYPRLNRNFEVVLDSDHLDSEDEVPTGRKRKASEAALAKQKAAAKKRAKKQNGDSDDDDNDDDGESLWTNKSGNPKPPVGSIDKCAKCSKKFTVVRPSATLFVGVPIYDCEDQVHHGR